MEQTIHTGETQGHPPSPEYVSEDGLMGSKPWFGAPYPARKVTRPKRVDVFELSGSSLFLTASSSGRFGD
ncbi:MAG: hypothetical protein ACYCPP_08385 [Nitrososphaerales archaeon]